ncbi:MAG TPA: 2Fe-2S iron-sulfur cluster-binding protein, partial [Candidatus Nanoarchaeia archaeon]|nr:2Fe-2S iron-sulfur cluster-binding protein [Candidatus Nanoarchaeia archaeon]
GHLIVHHQAVNETPLLQDTIMAIIKTDDASIEVPDGSRLRDVVDELGVPFSCRSGICGTCRIQVLEGEENLSPLNEQEEYYGGLDRKNRLSCQASIVSGTVKIDFEDRRESNVLFKR